MKARSGSSLEVPWCRDILWRPAVDFNGFLALERQVAHIVTSGDEMGLQEEELNSVIPDLRGIPLDRLSDMDDTVLDHSIDFYRRRIQETGVPLSSFNSSI